MLLYSKAELLLFQNKFERARQELEAISILYPNHTLDDEILFALGKMSEKQRKWEDAIGYYNKIVANHSQDILADNALFRIGDIYQFKLKDEAKANENYEKLILDYNSSMFVVEARKRYRSIRAGMSKEELFFKNIKNP
jgi:TolA-binding protein